MTGTSIDALDCALIAAEGEGLVLRATFERGSTAPLGDLAPRLRELARQQPMTAAEITGLARKYALSVADAVRELLRGEPCDLVAIHGQTVYHAPPLSWQLCNGALVAHALRVPVVFDLRAADLSAGGQGAPITPLADYVLLASPHERRVVLNLGGFSNFTALPPRLEPDTDLPRIQAGDICLCNQLLDTIARELLGVPFDRDGAAAASGQVVDALLEHWTARLAAQARAGRSLGTSDEPPGWLNAATRALNPTDVARTTCEAVARVIAHRIPPTDRVLVAGGGAANRTLWTSLQRHIAAPLQRTDDFDLPGAYREAAEMAVLGALCQDRVPITLPQVTGVPSPAPVSGVWVLP